MRWSAIRSSSALPVRQAAIVLMSALPYVEDVAPQIAAGGALRKPFDLDDPLERVRLAPAGPADGADAPLAVPARELPLPGITAVAAG